MQAIENSLGIAISTLPGPKQTLAASTDARRLDCHFTPALESKFLVPLTSCENEDADSLQNFNLVVNHVVPGAEGHDTVALSQEGIGLRGQRKAPPALQLPVLVTVLEKLNYPRNQAMRRVENQPDLNASSKPSISEIRRARLTLHETETTTVERALQISIWRALSLAGN